MFAGSYNFKTKAFNLIREKRRRDLMFQSEEITTGDSLKYLWSRTNIRQQRAGYDFLNLIRNGKICT